MINLLLLLTSLVRAECFVSFNAYGPMYAPETIERTEKITQEILKDHACDVIQLQEVWNTPQTNLLRQTMQPHYQIYAPNEEYRIGLMNFSRLPYQSAAVFSFKVNYDGGWMDEIREIAEAKKAFSIVNGALPNTITINTHLHPESEAIRLVQIMDILVWRVTNFAGALILSGDFNSAPGSLEHRFLQQTLNVEDAMIQSRGAYPEGFCTYCSRNRLSWLADDYVFDYVFLSRPVLNETHWRASSLDVVLTGEKNAPLSDHYGLKIQIAPYSEVATVDGEAKKTALLDILTEAENKLLGFEPATEEGYLTHLREMRAQIQSGQGPYGQYFQRIISNGGA